MGGLIIARILVFALLLMIGQHKVTAYCLQGVTYSGEYVREGVVAVDPEWIPIGTKIEIEGLGEFTALDTGSGIKGLWLDIWMPSCDDCMEWGVRYRDVRIIRDTE